MFETKKMKSDLTDALRAKLSPKAKELFTKLHKIYLGAMLTEIMDAFKPGALGMERATTALLARTKQTAPEPIQRAPQSLANHPDNPARTPDRPPNVVKLEPDHYDRC